MTLDRFKFTYNGIKNQNKEEKKARHTLAKGRRAGTSAERIGFFPMHPRQHEADIHKGKEFIESKNNMTTHRTVPDGGSQGEWGPTAVTSERSRVERGGTGIQGWGFQAHGDSGREGDLQMDDMQSRGLSSYLEEEVKPLAGSRPSWRGGGQHCLHTWLGALTGFLRFHRVANAVQTLSPTFSSPPHTLFSP